MPYAKLEDKVRIYYRFERLENDDMPVVFVNGSIFNHRQWYHSYLPAFRSFSKDSHSHLLYDYQGIGKSSPRTKPFNLQDLADELIGLLDFLGIEKVHLFGVSKGTLVSQIFTSLYPDRVQTVGGYGIVNLLAPKDGTVEKIFQDRLRDLLTLEDILDKRIDRSNFRRVVRILYTPAIFQKTYHQLNFRQKIMNWLLEGRAYRLLEGTPLETLELLLRYWAGDVLSEVDFYTSCLESIEDTPFLLLNGTKDIVTPPINARDLKTRLERVELIEYEGFEHISPNINKGQGRTVMAEYAGFLSQYV
ncbi:MAG: alpha/beta fold hydrolase [Candidatus Heimdallarchaeota archaeon]